MGLPAPEVNIGGREIVDAFVITLMVVMIHKGFDLCVQVCREKVAIQQGAVLRV